MKFHIRFAEQIVGLFILIAILVILIIVIFMGINQRWFAKDYHFTTKFFSGNGLDVGMPLKMKGFKIGTVDKIELDKDNTVKVNFHIFDTYYDKVTQNSVIELSTSPIGIGSSGLLFFPGKSNELIPDFSFIPSLDFSAGKKLVEGGLVNKPPADDTIVNIINTIGPLLSNVDTAVVSLKNLMTSLNGSLSGEESGPITDILTRINQILSKVNSILTDSSENVDTILVNTTGITSNLKTTTEGLTDTTGLVTRLLDPKGSIAKLLNDNLELYHQITGILSGVQMTTEELQTFTNYVNDSRPQISQLLEGSREALEKGKDVLEALRNNPLLGGGAAAGDTQPTTFQGYRKEDF